MSAKFENWKKIRIVRRDMERPLSAVPLLGFGFGEGKKITDIGTLPSHKKRAFVLAVGCSRRFHNELFKETGLSFKYPQALVERILDFHDS